MIRNELLKDSLDILCADEPSKYYEYETMLEDGNSPIANRLKTKLYRDLIDKAHIDFGDIPRSRGDITKYSGYLTMMETLATLKDLGSLEKSTELVKCVEIVQMAIANISNLKKLYTKGFSSKIDYVELEYNTFVFTCIEATTSLLYEYVDYVKTPSSPTIQIKLKDTKYRANLFYITQLGKFNKINKNGNYPKYLSTIIDKNKDKMVKEDAVIGGLAISSGVAMAMGIGAVLAILLSVIPITRRLIYHFKDLKRKVSESLELQAQYLEMNKACIEANSTLTVEKKKKILMKQEKIRQRLLRLSESLKVSSYRAEKSSQQDIDKSNKDMTKKKIDDEANNDDDFIIV